MDQERREQRGRRRRWPWILLVVVALGAVGVVARSRRPHVPVATVTDAQRQTVAALLARLAAHLGNPISGDPIAAAETEDEQGRYGNAAVRLADALGRAPDDVPVRLALASLALRNPVPTVLSADEARALVAVEAADAPDAPGLPAARGWLALADHDPAAAFAALAADKGTPSGLWARMRTDVEAGQDPSKEAEALLALRPGHGEACSAAARAASAQGDFEHVRQIVDGCTRAGARAPELQRMLGDVDDALGQFDAAVAAYRAGGADLHAAAIIAQEGLADPDGVVAAALADPVPPAALHGVWVGLMRQDLAAAKAAQLKIITSSAEGPEFSMARAAVSLASGRPDQALPAVATLSSAEAKVLSARAMGASGDRKGAEKAFAAALTEEPWNLAIHREHLAFLAAADPVAAQAAALAVARVDPITLALAADFRRRDAPWPALAPSPWPTLPEPGASLLAAVRGQPAHPVDPGWPAEVRGLLAMHQAAALNTEGDLAGARASADEAVAALPDAAGPKLMAAELARRAGDGASSKRLEAAAEALLPKPPPPLADAKDVPPPPLEAGALAWVKARQLASDGDTRGARALLRVAAEQQPDLAGLWEEIDALDRAGH